MKRMILLACVLFVGCYEAPKDILADRQKRQEVFTAIKNYDELIKINKEKLQKNDTPDNRIDLAENYYHVGDYEGSSYYLRPLIEAGRDYRAFLLQGKIFESNKEYDKALEFANKSIKLHSNNPSAYNLIGIIYSNKKNYKQARAYFLKAKDLFMVDEIVNNNLAAIEIADKNYKKAIAYLLPLYDRGYNDPRIISNLVLALARNNEDSRAITIATKENISRNPKKLVENLKRLQEK